jgi:hypothetical protein
MNPLLKGHFRAQNTYVKRDRVGSDAGPND